MERISPNDIARALTESRKGLAAEPIHAPLSREAAEGGCGVIGFASNVPISGRHLVQSCCQMHNRGNGKGGGIAASGLSPDQMRVSREVLASHYLIQIAYLDSGARGEVEEECLTHRFDITEAYAVDTLEDYREVPGLDMKPPDVVRYFCRVKPEMLARFAEENGLRHLPARKVEDEYVYQNSFRLNLRYYASLGEKRAFVLCHGRDLLVFKIVGYAEQAANYYRLEDLTAHVWIGHQRYPTKGRIWHPGGAHPFVGVNEALVHNGDFANYHRVTEYLRQRNIVPLFLTDTEVSVLLFDLWDRVYGYPLEVLLEALAPTTERDFDMLPPEKKALYAAVQQTHLAGSPDGPWFFIIARSRPDAREWQLLGITDTSMLRPQVFALYESGPAAGHEGRVQIGLIASERQAINACLRSLAGLDSRFEPLADRYWVARGGSYTDGGAFVFSVRETAAGRELTCADKFGRIVAASENGRAVKSPPLESCIRNLSELVLSHSNPSAPSWFEKASSDLSLIDMHEFSQWLDWMSERASLGEEERTFVIEALSLIRDRRFDPGSKKRSTLLAMVEKILFRILRDVPPLEEANGKIFARITAESGRTLRPPRRDGAVLVIDGASFPSEGEDSAARLIASAYCLGWRRFLAFDLRGGRFVGCGLGPRTDGARLDIYGDPGDYLGSGLDGAEIVVHSDAQDQVGQILKRGRLVIHGEVGQTFLYGAKGGEIYVLGSAAGRPLINAVGRPRAVINGTCLDYLAESFMAGDPLAGGGFVIMNGVRFDDMGRLAELETPYPGGNLFSLASGGAIYIRDPHGRVDDDQLNGGRFASLSDADWTLIEPYLRENETLFGIRVSDLLSVGGVEMPPARVYRKVEVRPLDVEV